MSMPDRSAAESCAPASPLATPQVGSVWRDRDPRGGPTFRVRGLTPDGQHARVANTTGPSRPRTIKVDRLLRHYECLTPEAER